MDVCAQIPRALVMDRGELLDQGHVLDASAVILVTGKALVGPSAEKNGILHRRHVVFWDGVEHVADKEIRRQVTVMQQRRAQGMGMGRHGWRPDERGFGFNSFIPPSTGQP